MKSMRIAILGTGGVGAYLGAKFWKSGHHVVFVARGEHLAAMRKQGLRLESTEGNILVRSQFVENLVNLGPFDLIIVAVKSFDTHAAAQIARSGLKKETAVLSIQNGVENEELLGKALGESHILTGVAYIFSKISSYGLVRHEGGTGKFILGEFSGGKTSRLEEIGEAFSSSGITAEIQEDIRQALWEKWIFICGLSGMTSYARKSIGEILADAGLSSMLQSVVAEAAQIARAKKISPFTAVEEKADAHFKRLPPGSTSSMYYDLMQGKRLEIDALNGAVVSFGKQLNIRTPSNSEICLRLGSAVS